MKISDQSLLVEQNLLAAVRRSIKKKLFIGNFHDLTFLLKILLKTNKNCKMPRQ